MNLKLKRLVRTPTSEQYAVQDADQKGDDGQSACIGKLDLHYTDDGTYGTLLIWQGFASNLSEDALQILLDDILTDFAEPMGVSGEYVIEYFSPSLESYSVHSNIAE
jgi:hypothetical protein